MWRMHARRVGDIVVNGSVANVYLVGLENLAQVNLAGSATLFVEPLTGALRLIWRRWELPGSSRCKGSSVNAQ